MDMYTSPRRTAKTICLVAMAVALLSVGCQEQNPTSIASVTTQPGSTGKATLDTEQYPPAIEHVTPARKAQRAMTTTSGQIANGSFETGDFAGWTVITNGNPYRVWAVTGPGQGGGFSLVPTAPQDGNFVAWNGFDGEGPMSFVLYQDVAISANVAAELTWMDRIQWDFGPGGNATEPRIYEVQVRDPNDDSVLETVFSFSTGTQAQNPTGDTQWQSRSADLSSYAGSTVRLAFFEAIPQSFTGPGQLEFDVVCLTETILNQAPDCSNATASLDELWPANHKFVQVDIEGVTDPDGDPVSITIDAVTQDEAVDAEGDGATCPDAQLVGGNLELRAERSGSGNGRVYHVSFTADDGRGGSCSGTVLVCVPHDRRRGSSCVDDGAIANSLATCVPVAVARPDGRLGIR